MSVELGKEEEDWSRFDGLEFEEKTIEHFSFSLSFSLPARSFALRLREERESLACAVSP